MGAKSVYGITISAEDLERLRNAAYWTEGENVSTIFVRGALNLVESLEKERGSPFPAREGEVKTGRPKKAT